jgi:very-short-patch-repair endonuclease
MVQPIKNKKENKPKKKSSHHKSCKKHPKYGTSKLEKKFAKEFLEKLGIKYVEQFEAKDIKRFYDFYLTEYRVLIEVDGDYW